MEKFVLTLEGKSLKNELLKFFEYNDSTPTNSAFNQLRAQILPEAFEFLFHEFTKKYSDINKKYKRYRLIACDGSDICISHNPNDIATYFQATSKKGYNLLHLNALYDLNNRTYIDAIIFHSNKKAHKRN